MKGLIKILLVPFLFFIASDCLAQIGEKSNIDKETDITKQLEEGANFCITKEDYDCALLMLDKLLDKKKNRTDLYLKRARVLIELEDYSSAFSDLHTALSHNSNIKSNIYYELGELHLKEGKTEESIENFEAALDHNPQCVPCIQKLAVINSRMFETDMAIFHYKQLIRLNSDNPDYYRNLGEEYIKIYKIDSALLMYNKAIGLNPDDALMYMRRGILLYENSDPEAADMDIRQAIRKDTSIKKYILAEVRKFTLSNNLSIADRILEISTQELPDDFDLFVQQAKISFYRRDYMKAIQSYSKAIEIDSSNVEIYYERGKMYYEEQMFENAITDLQKYLSEYPTNTDCLIKLGYAHYKIGEIDKAKSDWENAVTHGESKGQNYINIYIKEE